MNTDKVRAEMASKINANPGTREYLEAKYGQVWDTSELQKDFEVTGFAAPYVVVTRKADRAVGSLEFQHNPRLYYNFQPN